MLVVLWMLVALTVVICGGVVYAAYLLRELIKLARDPITLDLDRERRHFADRRAAERAAHQRQL
jgi:hypothetical protein